MKNHLFCVGIEFKKASEQTASYAYRTAYLGANDGGVLKSMLTLNEAIIDVKEG